MTFLKNTSCHKTYRDLIQSFFNKYKSNKVIFPGSIQIATLYTLHLSVLNFVLLSGSIQIKCFYLHVLIHIDIIDYEVIFFEF